MREEKSMQAKNLFGKRKVAVLLAVVLCLSLLTACNTGGSSQEKPSTAATDAAAGSTSISAAADEAISVEELKTAFDEAAPYEGEVQIVAQSAVGDDIGPKDVDLRSKLKASFRDLDGEDHRWNEVTGVRASSTLRIKGYDYSAWNLFDWSKKTIWAEGALNEGIGEGFMLFMDRPNRIDGIRIYPGFQENKNLYRNNYLPCLLYLEVGGQSITCDLRKNLHNFEKDGQYYWVDCYFSEPIYSDYISVIIGDVTSYGSNPDPDCCISEFHPFYY